MPDYYHAPALILTVLLLPAFVYLYHRFRDTRTLLWLLGFCCSILSMLMLYAMGELGLSPEVHPWIAATGRSAILVGTALFLGSLSPLGFNLGRLRILYVFPYSASLVVIAILHYGVWRGASPSIAQFCIFPALGAIALVTVLFWGADRYTLPRWLGFVVSLLFGVFAFWGYFSFGIDWGLIFVNAASLLMTALLVVFFFRRFSPGVLLSVLGLGAWSLTAIRAIPAVVNNATLDLHVIQVIAMGKVVAAIGMILLTLEDEVALNKAAQEREHRARRELEAYTRLVLAYRRVEDFDHQGNEICATIADQSRFSKVALVLHSGGRYRLVGAAGLDVPVVRALDELAARISANSFLTPGSAPSAVGDSQTVLLDLQPWLLPGDDLKRLGFTSFLAVPMVNRSVTEGALLLSGIRPIPGLCPGVALDLLRPDDVLPIEMFAGRLQATRSQIMTFEKLIDSEKFGHLGQLATSVTQQLNNPLTVILGYASLLEGTAVLDPHDRKAVESILIESRRMRSTLESLARVARPQSDHLVAVSVAELLSDLSELHRSEFLQRSIEFRVNIAPHLPRVMCSAPQLRQAVRHCLQFAMEAVESGGASPAHPKAIRLEASLKGHVVQILVAHSGPGFISPERAFDPFGAPEAGIQFSGVNLSLCATVMRENNGHASAINLEPHGAAIVLELKAA